MSSRYTLTPDGRTRVTVIPGDGIGPEVVDATRRIIDAAGVRIAWEECQAGASVFRQGQATGVPEATIRSIRETRVTLKGPLETPVGYGEKSANVTLRKLFETFGNVRPVRRLPGVPTPFSDRPIDLVVVRENVEDLYAGIEHMQTPGVAQCLKLMSRKGCEKIVRLAFEVARAEGRKKVHCATKANIMKLTEGLMKRTFEEVAKEYPDLEAHHIIIDNCCHQLVRSPEQFDVIVTSNMNGDIMSDLTSGLIGGLGFAPGANLGSDIAIFEAVHGSAPKYAGKDVINPTAMLLSGLMMLRHIDEFEAAERIENALYVTLAEGAHTRDVKVVGSLGTRAFTDRIIGNLGREAAGWKVRHHERLQIPNVSPRLDFVRPETRELAGVDVFLESAETPSEIGRALEQVAEATPFRLKMISNRGTRVHPDPGNLPDCVDHWRCRFVVREDQQADDPAIFALAAAASEGRRWMHLEKLERLDGAPGWTKAQGED